jgi:preprotein translocase SecE subunit
MAKASEKGTVVRRVKASGTDSSAARTDEKVTKNKATTVAQKKVTPVKTKKPAATKKSTPFFLLRPVFAVGRYFRNSWRELRQVRWPNRRATWKLTLAVVLFCVFFASVIMLFDWIFNWVIQEVVL